MNSLSIVSICFNNLEELKRTIESVLIQEKQPDEYWIIDGSNNGEIRNYLETNQIAPYIKWISEPDKGISDAFNKGITRCSSDIIHILNSGDYYIDSYATQRAMQCFDNDPDLMWVHGIFKQQIGGEWILSGTAFNPSKLYLGMGKVAHPTMFVRREVYDRVGLFEVGQRDAMDYDFLVRIRNEKFQFINEPMTVFTPGGNSDVNWKRTFKESQAAYKRHIGKDWRLNVAYWRQVIVHGLLKTPIGKWYLHSKKAS